MPRITISYRRADSAANTGRIFDRLERHYGSDSVFMDIDAIPLGANYKRHIDETLAKTDFMLVIVGPRWLGPRDDGTFRINDGNDPVRIELESALRNGTMIIPVLVDGATMPGPSDLPDSLEEFAFINAAEVASGRDFTSHVDRITRFLDATIAARDADKERAPPPADEPPVRLGDTRPPEPVTRQEERQPDSPVAPRAAQQPLPIETANSNIERGEGTAKALSRRLVISTLAGIVLIAIAAWTVPRLFMTGQGQPVRVVKSSPNAHIKKTAPTSRPASTTSRISSASAKPAVTPVPTSSPRPDPSPRPSAERVAVSPAAAPKHVRTPSAQPTKVATPAYAAVPLPRVQPFSTAYLAGLVAELPKAEDAAPFFDAYSKALSAAASDEERANAAIAYLQHLPRSAPTLLALGIAYADISSDSASYAACRKSYELAHTPEALACLAYADYALKNYQEAAQAFLAMDLGAPGSIGRLAEPGLVFAAAVSYERMNRSTEAIAKYKAVLSSGAADSAQSAYAKQALARLK